VAPPSADALARVPLFAALERSDRAEVAAQLRELEFEQGSTILRQGERGPRVLAFFVVAEGEVSVSRDGEEIARLGSGDFFGEIGLFQDVPRNATVKAETDLRCYALSSWEFRPFVEAHPSIGWQLLAKLAERVVNDG
jgi:CRP/FNR family cyclic AMP-dependent transcriptional regulator